MSETHTQRGVILSTVNEHVGWLRLNRECALNSIDLELLHLLKEEFEKFVISSQVRSIILTGTGAAFCAGVDLAVARDLVTEPDKAYREFLSPFNALVEAIRTCPKPLIAAVNGTCVGGGLELILACDVIIASNNAKIGDGHINYGLMPASGSIKKLLASIGHSKTSELMLSGELYSAKSLLDLGLLHQVVSPVALDVTAQLVAKRMASKSPDALRDIKELIRQEANLTCQEASALELSNARRNLSRDSPKQGIAAFFEGHQKHSK